MGAQIEAKAVEIKPRGLVLVSAALGAWVFPKLRKLSVAIVNFRPKTANLIGCER